MVQLSAPAGRAFGMSAPSAVPGRSAAGDPVDRDECLLSWRDRWVLSAGLLMASIMITIGERLPLRTCKPTYVHRIGRPPGFQGAWAIARYRSS
jgi:hypothetical protein